MHFTLTHSKLDYISFMDKICCNSVAMKLVAAQGAHTHNESTQRQKYKDLYEIQS